MLLREWFDPGLHRVYEGELTRYLRRELHEQNLFVFRHVRTGNWIVGIWEPYSYGAAFRSVLCIGPSLQCATRSMVEHLRWVWSSRESNFRERLRAAESAWAQEQAEEQEEYDESLRWLAKRDGSIDHPYFHPPDPPTKTQVRGAGYGDAEERSSEPENRVLLAE